MYNINKSGRGFPVFGGVLRTHGVLYRDAVVVVNIILENIRVSLTAYIIRIPVYRYIRRPSCYKFKLPMVDTHMIYEGEKTRFIFAYIRIDRPYTVIHYYIIFNDQRLWRGVPID